MGCCLLVHFCQYRDVQVIDDTGHKALCPVSAVREAALNLGYVRIATSDGGSDGGSTFSVLKETCRTTLPNTNRTKSATHMFFRSR